MYLGYDPDAARESWLQGVTEIRTRISTEQLAYIVVDFQQNFNRAVRIKMRGREADKAWRRATLIREQSRRSEVRGCTRSRRRALW